MFEGDEKEEEDEDEEDEEEEEEAEEGTERESSLGEDFVARPLSEAAAMI